VSEVAVWGWLRRLGTRAGELKGKRPARATNTHRFLARDDGNGGIYGACILVGGRQIVVGARIGPTGRWVFTVEDRG
jgi:hypothetical protein